MWTDTDHYRDKHLAEEAWREVVEELQAEIAEWKAMYVEAVSRPRPAP
jgi:hypothetical protein